MLPTKLDNLFPPNGGIDSLRCSGLTWGGDSQKAGANLSFGIADNLKLSHCDTLLSVSPIGGEINIP
jgi:hypothetical protein